MPNTPDAATVAICDSSEISRIGISSSLREHGLRVVAEANDLDSALRLLAAKPAQVVLVDVSLPPQPKAAGKVMAAAAAAGLTVIAVGVEGSPERIFPALRAGASGYLTKDMPGRAWSDAIQAAVRGEAPLSRSMTAMLIEEFRSQAEAAPLSELLPSDRRLTRREWQVLSCIADGRTNRGVADELSISVETVRTHVSNILSKLDAPNRSAAAAKYQQLRAAARA